MMVEKEGGTVASKIAQICNSHLIKMGYSLDQADVQIVDLELNGKAEKVRAEDVKEGIELGTKIMYGDPGRKEAEISLNKIFAKAVQNVMGKDCIQRVQFENAIRNEHVDEQIVYDIIAEHKDRGDLAYNLNGFTINNRWWENNGSQQGSTGIVPIDREGE